MVYKSNDAKCKTINFIYLILTVNFVTEYYIGPVIIKGRSFRHNSPLSLEEAIELAREFSLRGYLHHVSEKISDFHYEKIELNELKRRLKENKK